MPRFRTIVCFTALIVLMLCASGCRKRVKTAKPPRIGDTETGIASWYGHPYHGRRAANGEIYDMEGMTAAHRTLPFETWVRVHNLSNDKKVEVRIQDRGPFINGRIIDLSRAAAREIQMIGPGVTKVRLTVIAPPRDVRKQAELFAVQVGSFRDRDRAEALAQTMRRLYSAARVVERAAQPPMWRVLVGELQSEAEAEALASQIGATGTEGFVVRLDVPAPE
jgi:rare lipoprotein A